MKKVKALKNTESFVLIEDIKFKNLWILFAFLKKENLEQTKLMVTGNIIEIIKDIGQPAQKLIREIIKQSQKKNQEELQVNLNVLMNNFHKLSKNQGQLMAVALDEEGYPCLVRTRIFKELLPDPSPEIKLEFAFNHIAGKESLTIAQQDFLGITDKIKEIETILTEIADGK